MSEEMNKELETEVIAGVTAEEPVETMEGFCGGAGGILQDAEQEEH